MTCRFSRTVRSTWTPFGADPFSMPLGLGDRRLAWLLLVCCGLCLGGAGCQPLQPSPYGHSPLAKPKPSSDASILEILTIEVDAGRVELLHRMWDEVDDQAIGVEARRAIDRNGIRAGVASSQLPAAVHELIGASQAKPLAALPYKQIQSRARETFDLDVTPIRELLDWQIAGEQAVVRTGSCQHAAGALGLRTHPFGDRSVNLVVTPKLRHGTPRNKYTVEQSQFLLRPLLDETPFHELEFACRMRVGQTLIVGPTDPPGGLGRHFFAEPERGMLRILLIRLVHSQPDDLFAPRKTTPPLVTPGT